MPYRISAFADEISTDIQVQMDHVLHNGINFVAMRGANGKNVLDFEDFQIPLTKTQFNNRGIKFTCIGSPVGKCPIDTPIEQELERLKVAIQRANQFETKIIRVFSFYVPEGDDPAKHKDKVLEGTKAFADAAAEAGVNLLLENEKELYGDNADRCLEILENVNGKHFQLAFDFANFVQVGQDPWDAWQKLKGYVKDFHIKDCHKETGKECPAGEGDGRVRDILKDAFDNNWAGLLTFEPHLSESGKFGGHTSPELFAKAVDALKKILDEIGAK